jgi:hypothetical protein
MVALVVEELAGDNESRAIISKLDIEANSRVASRLSVCSILALLVLKKKRLASRQASTHYA